MKSVEDRCQKTTFAVAQGRARPCAVWAGRATLKKMGSSSTPPYDRFIRVPTTLLEALLKVPLTGVQWRLLFWVMRRTYGWNRNATPFTWYRIAIDTGITRPAIFRAGQALLKNRILILQGKQLAIEIDSTRWARNPGRSRAGLARLESPNSVLPAGNNGRCEPTTVPLSASNQAVATTQRLSGE